MSTEEGKKILNGYIHFLKKIASNQDLIGFFEKTLNHWKLDWPDWERFKADRLNFEWTSNEKKNGKLQFHFINERTKHEYCGKVENIHKCLIEHARIVYDYDNYSRYNTRGSLIKSEPVFSLHRIRRRIFLIKLMDFTVEVKQDWWII
jgi:hypothetical protein